ncbi:MAG: ribosome-recycling factor [Minisyncoccia bacterium]
MAYSFTDFSSKGKEIVEWLKREYTGISTGRATPAILDLVSVESFGSRMAIPHIASVTIEDPRTLRVAPWDKSQVKVIEKGLADADLGLSVSVDDGGLRIFFPQLTTERRAQLVKVLKDRLEDARVKVRMLRQETQKDIEAESLPEDDAKRASDELQKKVDEYNSLLEDVFTKKEGEVMN